MGMENNKETERLCGLNIKTSEAKKQLENSAMELVFCFSFSVLIVCELNLKRSEKKKNTKRRMEKKYIVDAQT